MSTASIAEQLDQAALLDDFVGKSYQLVAQWERSAATLDTVEIILRFMETHSFLDYGTPGPIVHFVERFLGAGYEQKLVQSVARKPTSHTVWMLNRLINGAPNLEKKRELFDILLGVLNNPLADSEALVEARNFIAFQKPFLSQ